MKSHLIMSDYKIVQSSYQSDYVIPNPAYTDWIDAMSTIPNLNILNIIELGLGQGTKILLDNFKHVYSFEVAKDDEWYNKCVKGCGLYTNWTHKFYPMSQFGLDIADEKLLQSSGMVRDMEPMKKYFQALEEFLPTITSMDVALVDQGFHFRGEAVNYFLEKQIPIVIAHDTYNHNHIYGYDKLIIPDNYKSETFGGMGTTVFKKQ